MRYADTLYIIFSFMSYIGCEQFNKKDFFRKRQGSGCLFHGGLAHNCDYKDLVGAVDEADHWGSDLSPGKVIIIIYM